MKRIFSVVMIGLAIAGLTQAFRYAESMTNVNGPQEETAMFPDNITTIFQNSCFHCHGPEANNAKAKLHLDFGKWDDMSDSKKIGKLGKIQDMLNKGKMPPSRFLNDNPDAFSDKDRQALLKWSSEESDRLLGEGN